MFVHSTKTTKTFKIQDSIEIVKEVLPDFVKKKILMKELKKFNRKNGFTVKLGAINVKRINC